MLVSEFLTNLKRRGQYQAAQTVLSDDDLIAFANDEMRMVICPKILSLRDNFFQGMKDYTLTAGRRYRLPLRTLGSRISHIFIIDSSGNQYDLPQVPNTAKPNNASTGFYVTQGEIVIVGTIPVGTMRIVYPIRPPKMSTTAAALGLVNQLTPASTTITIATTAALNGVYEVIRKQSPFRTITPTAFMTPGGIGAQGFDFDCPSEGYRFATSDIFIVPDSTHIVPLEEQLCDWLLQRTHMRVLEALGQTDELQAAGSKLADIQRDCMALMTPRVENTPKTIFGGQILGWSY